MIRKKATLGIVAVFVAFSVAALPLPVHAGKGSDTNHLDMTTTPKTPEGFEGASGRVKYNMTGPTIQYVLKASGLVPGEDYLVAFCDVAVGGGTADKNGNLEIWSSAVDSWLESSPRDPFELRRMSESANWPYVWNLDLILQSPPSGYEP